MTKQRMPEERTLIQTLAGPEGDVLREAVVQMVRQIMEAEVGAIVGAAPFERSEERTTQRNGHRERPWDTRLGRILLRIPKLRQGAYFPSFLEPRRRAERALVAVVQEAYVSGVSTRAVDDLVKALGDDVTIDKSMVSRMCRDLDEEARAFRERPIEVEVPYVWLDAVYEKVREGGRVLSKAVVVAIGVTREGTRTILGFDVGSTESEAFWKDFLRSLVRRGLRGVELVISDAHVGIRESVRKVMPSSTWQRCRVHTMRSILTHVPKAHQAMALAVIKTIFAQPTQAEAREHLGEVVKQLSKRCGKAAQILKEAADDVLAYMAFPTAHWRQIHSTNPLERLIKEIRRRTRVVGIFPTDKSVLRLVGMLLLEQDDEWQAMEKAYFSQESMARLRGEEGPPLLMKETATG